MAARPAILVVDDDRFFRTWVADVLGTRGHAVTDVADGPSALAELTRHPFDLVLTDVMMPQMHGLSLIARIRERDPNQEIILVSQREDAAAAAEALKAGLADYLVKPLDPAALALCVDRALERAALRRERTELLRENQNLHEHEALHGQALELLSNPDLEWLQERLLAELMTLCDAQSAALWVMDEHNQLALRAYRGLLHKHLLAERISPQSSHVQRLRAGVPWVEGTDKRSFLFVPMRVAGELVALAQLSDPLGELFAAPAIDSARRLADFAAVGIKSGRRLLALQRLGLKDRDTAAYNLSYFTDYASKEIYKARRYGRTFSLLTFSIDNLLNIRSRLGASEARRGARGVIRALSKIIRDSDVIAKASDQEFYLLLPETDYFGALMFGRRALVAAREEPTVAELESRMPLAIVLGAGTFPKDGDDFDELVHQCRRRMDERRVSLQRRLHLDGLDFWDEVDLLLGTASSPRLPTDERAEPSRRGRVADLLFDELQAEVARELVREPNARGVVYVGGPEVRSDLPILAGLEGLADEVGCRVYVLGRRRDFDAHPAVTPVFLEGDERMSRHQFIFWLNETSAYGLIQRKGRGATWGFHTSDTALVDGLVSKLQAAYDLQPL